MQFITDVLGGLRTLVFPEICIVCGERFEVICQSCKHPWQMPGQQFHISDLKISTVVRYDNSSSKVILKAKEDRNKAALQLMALSLATSVASWRHEVNLNQVLLVPIPSTKKAIKRRGDSFLHPVLDMVRHNLRSKYGIELKWESLLFHQKRVRDQSELSFQQRAENLANAFAVKEKLLTIDEIQKSQIILIDDVVTTGATLLSATQALEERKMTVLGAATACATSHRLPIP